MKHSIVVALIVTGGLVVLGPVFANAYTYAANKENIAEYYRLHTSGSKLPEAMRPAGSGAYAWACWAAGAGMVAAGVRAGRAPSSPGVEKLA